MQSRDRLKPGSYVYAVHTVHAEEIAATALVTFDLDTAEKYAAAVSDDPGVLAGAVTRFVVDGIGVRTAVALYVRGQRQDAPYVSDDRRVLANGHGSASVYSPH